MTIDLVFFDEGTVVPLEMQKAFSGNPRLSVRQLAPDLIASQQSLDALYQSLFTAERWGARPLYNQAQVLETNRQDSWPPFIVAGVGLRPEDHRAGDPVEELKLSIEAVIDAVSSYNADSRVPIKSIGFWTRNLGIHRMDPYEAGQIIRSIFERKTAGVESQD